MAASNFERALSCVLKQEGGFVDHPADPGGATSLGITRATLARARGRPVSIADVKALTRAEAAAIYRRLYWDAVAGDQLPPGLDLAVFDLAVNSGPARALRLLQRCLDVAQDGVLGPVTLGAARACEPGAAIRALARARLGFLHRLATWRVFGRGWNRRVEEVAKIALALAASSSQVADNAPRAQRGPPQPTEVSSSPSPIQKGPTMTDMKSILASRTVWANVIGLAAMGLALAGIDTGDLDVDRLAEAAAQLVAAGSFVASTIFRVAATRQLKGALTPPA